MTSWSKRALTTDSVHELAQLARALRAARERRGLSVAQVAKRLDVNPRVVLKLEKGEPTVALGALIELLSFYHLARGFAEFVAPERDSPAALAEARRLQRGASRRGGNTITDDEVDF